MQHLFQKADGERVKVEALAYAKIVQANPKRFTILINERHILVFCVKGTENARSAPRLKYGGSAKERLPFTLAASMCSKGTRARVNQLYNLE